MSTSKIDYRLKRSFYPRLEELGFKKCDVEARCYVKFENDYKVLCAVMVEIVDPLDPFGFSDDKSGFIASVGIAYPFFSFGFPRFTEDTIAGASIGMSAVRSSLQRTVNADLGGLGYVWDLSKMSPDEAIADLVSAFDNAGLTFFEDWSNPEKAWDTLNRPYEDDSEADIGGVYAGTNRSEMTSIHFASLHMSIAHMSNRVDDEIAAIRAQARLLDDRGLELETVLQDRLEQLDEQASP